MTYQPVIPLGGYAGWQFLQRTENQQRAAFNASEQVTRDLDYFRESIGNVETPEQLVSDFRLLNVALGAFGLEDDAPNKFFIQKILEEGSINTDALANKLTDKRYLAMSKAFGFGDFDTPNTKLSTFPDEILSKFKDRSFETKVGEANEDMRLALNARRELAALAETSSSETTKWFTIMGTPPLRSIFEQALNLPTSFASLTLDRQLEEFQERAESLLGSSEISQFTDEEATERLIQRFMLTSSTQTFSAANLGASTALILLGGG